VHELSITQSVLNIALEAAHTAGASRITAIDLVIGDLSSVVDDSVQFYFDFLSQGTPAEGAMLRFQRLPAQVTCRDCVYTFTTVLPLILNCPVCGGTQLSVSGGREFRVESIEVDDESNRST
jgi:hydrogenase nickel incorporation protein HypA/HybF